MTVSIKAGGLSKIMIWLIKNDLVSIILEYKELSTYKSLFFILAFMPKFHLSTLIIELLFPILIFLIHQ